MTKKDYIAFARLFIEANVYTCPETLELCKRTADLFARDNSRFDRNRYLDACGVRPEDR